MENAGTMAIASTLAQRTGFSNAEQAIWTIASTLGTDAFADPVAYWLPEKEGIAYWVTNEGGLFVGIAHELPDGGCEVKITAHHLDPAAWTVELACENATLGGPLTHPGIKTMWTFRSSAGGFALEVPGEVIFRGHEPGAPDDAEKFARALAQRLDWSS